MSTISTGSFAKLLWPGINAIYGAKYKEFKTEYPEIFSYNKSTKAYEEDIGLTGFGLAQVKTEGGSITYDDTIQGFVSRYTHVTYGLGFIITREMYEDNQYPEVSLRKATSLAFSMRQTKETVAANVLNRAFNSSYTGGDGLELCSTLHVNKTGGTWRNELSTAADISEAALEQACIDIASFTTDRGLKINIMPRKIIVPKELEFDVARIIKGVWQVDSANRNINAMKVLGSIPEGYAVNHYLTDTNNWFILTNCPDGMKLFERRADEFGTDQEFDTENAKFKATGRYSFGWSDPRGIFGSAPA